MSGVHEQEVSESHGNSVLTAAIHATSAVNENLKWLKVLIQKKMTKKVLGGCYGVAKEFRGVVYYLKKHPSFYDMTRVHHSSFIISAG